VERVWSEKAEGGQRPIGTPAFEDTSVQRAAAMYAQDCSDCSDGFRPGRSAHAALHELRERCMQEGSGWIVDAEVSGDVDSIDRTRLQEVLRQRVNEGSIRRLRGKWRRAGVMEDGGWHPPETGVVPGGVIAPVLAHRFLPHVLEAWFAQEVQPRLKGRGFLRRFADAVCLGCALETEARKMMAVLPKRFARCGLTIPPTQTTVIAFRNPHAPQASAKGNGPCDFLGLTHYWTQSRRGFWVSKRRTARQRLRRTKKSLWRWCRVNRHAPLKYQYQMLCLKGRGPFRYDGIRGNFPLLEEVRRDAEKAWRSWLSRRRSTSAIGWEQFQRLLETYVLPTPKIVHNS
jgi:RNA-directed DNA polymerase